MCVHACINAWQHSCHRMSACLISQWAISGPAALFLFDAVLHGIALQQSPCPGQCFMPYWNSTPCPWSGLSKRNGSTTRAVGRRVRVRRSTKALGLRPWTLRELVDQQTIHDPDSRPSRPVPRPYCSSEKMFQGQGYGGMIRRGKVSLTTVPFMVWSAPVATRTQGLVPKQKVH